MEVIEHTCDVFLARVVYIADCDYQELNQYLKDTYAITDPVGAPDDAGTTVIIDYVEDGKERKIFLVWIEKRSDICTNVHEFVHLIDKIFQYKGVSFCHESAETIAYYMEHWLRKFVYQPSSPKKKIRKSAKSTSKAAKRRK